MCENKRTEELKIRVSPELKRDLMELALQDDRSVAEFIARALYRYVYGHHRVAAEKSEGPDRP